MDLPVEPPVKPMLGKLARELPGAGFLYEPKWDGFRCLAFCDGDEVDLRSRHDRPLARYFPEIVAALRGRRIVLDGEIVVEGDFADLLARVHPAASRVERLARETPAAFVAFDVLARGDDDMRERPFAERRALLEGLGLEGTVRLTPATDDPDEAARWLADGGRGLDGVMAKPLDAPYSPGARTMVKVKPERTADCVVAGFRWFVDRPVLSSLVLGLYDEAGELHHVGVVTSFTEKRRRELAGELRPLAVPIEGHPWERGFLMEGGATGRLAGAAGRWSPDEMPLDWVPLAPVRVCEVAFDQVDGHRFRHPARFRRWRPDREPESCTLDQLVAPAPAAR